MTYDQWKTTPPWDQGGYLCAGCEAVVASPGDRCPDCEDERVAEEALMAFCEWEPEGPDEIEEQGTAVISGGNQSQLSRRRV